MQKRSILFILIFAFLLRLISLNQSLWLDEAVVANAVQNYSYSELISKFAIHDFHPPLYYLFIKFWTGIFGCSEIALRMPSVLFSLLTGYFLYLLAGNWAALFFLFNPLVLYYSQEARPYMLVTFFLTLSLYALEKINQKKTSLKYLVILASSLILSLYTFYGSTFFIVAILIYLIFKKQFSLLTKLCLVLFIAGLGLLPLLIKQWQNSQQMTHLVINWKQVLGPANFKNLFLIPLKFSFGRISFYPKALYYFLSGIWAIFIWRCVLKYNSKNFKYFILLLLPIIFGFIFSFFTPLLQYFRFLYLVPIMSILLCLNIKTKLIKKTVLAGFLGLSLIYLLIPQFHREDWKSLAQQLPKNKKAFGIPSSLEGVKYYKENINIKDIRNIKESRIKNNKILVIPYTFDIYGIDYPNLMVLSDYKLGLSRSFRELKLDIWQSIR